MTCHHPIVADTAALTTPAVASDRPTSTPTEAACGPACPPTAWHLHGTGTSGPIIASRCKRLTFRSNESRKRFLSVHRALASKTWGGDDAHHA